MHLPKFLTASLAALVASTSIFAASDIETRVSQLEKQMTQVRTDTALETYGATMATARADVDGRGWSLLLGPVYYSPDVDGTEFAYSEDSSTQSLPINGRTKEMKFDWDWGLRAALGYNFEHDDWDVNLGYLWFGSSGSRNVDGGLNGSIIPLKGSARIVTNCNGFGADALFSYSQKAKSQYDFDFHGLDFEIGRDFFNSKWLALRTHFGVKTVWMDLEQVTRYTGGAIALNADTGLGIHTVDIKEDSDFWGLGLRTGLDTRWFLGSGFSLFGNAAGALMYGKFDVDLREKFSLCPKDNRIVLSANTRKFVPHAQLMFGLRYDRYFDDHHQAIAIRLGYDAQYYWNANQMLKVDAKDSAFRYFRSPNDVMFHGLILDAEWSF